MVKMLRLRQCLARAMTSLTTVRPCTHVTVHQSTQPTIVKYADDLQVSGHPHVRRPHLDPQHPHPGEEGPAASVAPQWRA